MMPVSTTPSSVLWDVLDTEESVLIEKDSKKKLHVITSVSSRRSDSEVIKRSESIESQAKITKWLLSIGLRVNPFAALDASQDPYIPFYLIDHDQYDLIYGDFTSFIYAPPGGGKSAFRVRAARDCRIGKNGRKIFPVIYNLPEPGDSALISYDSHLSALAKAMAFELLLFISYNSSSIVNSDSLIRELQNIFSVNFEINYLQQMSELDIESTQPLLDAFDRTAKLLPNPPGKKSIIRLAEKLRNKNLFFFSNSKPNSEQRFKQIVSFVTKELGFEAIYVLVDRVDAYIETGKNVDGAVNAIDCLLRQTDDWREKKIFIKYFLPSDVQLTLEKRFPVLTSNSKVANIRWDAETLRNVIQQRLKEASGGKYGSLRAISSLPLRGAKHAPEEVLAHEISELNNPTPRDMINAVNKLLLHHADHENQEKLTPSDLKAAIDWIRIRSELPSKSFPA